MSSRRDFLRSLGTISAGAASWAAAPAQAAPAAAPHWAMAIDLARCIGCQACTVACLTENRVAEGGYRTFVATYELRHDERTDTVMLPRLCNHCEQPACVPVCPVGATFRREDGAVLVDAETCVGCGYCVQACPYEARFIDAESGRADKCTFCGHRLEAGLLPACVETCVGGARVFGDLDDPASAVAKLLAGGRAKVLKPEAGTRPRVFYLGLDERFAGRVEGRAALSRAGQEQAP